MTWNTSFQPLLACKVSFEKSAASLMGTPLKVTVSFSLATFKILCFNPGYYNYVVPWGVLPWVQPLLASKISFEKSADSLKGIPV